MNILDYYRKYLIMDNKHLRRSSLKYIQESPKSFDLYLYLLKDDIEQSKAMSVRFNASVAYCNSKLIERNNTFQVLIPDIYNKYGLSIATIPTDIFKLRCFFYCGRMGTFAGESIGSVLGFADWLGIDKGKIHKAAECLTFNRQLVDGIDIPQGYECTPFISQYESDISKCMDHYSHFIAEQEFTDYIIYAYENDRLKKHTFKKEGSKQTEEFFYFPWNKGRSILFRNRVGMVLFKNNQIVYYNRYFSEIDMYDFILMIGRINIFNFLEKVNYFQGNKWREYVDSEE